MKINFSTENIVRKIKYGNRLRPSRDWLILIAGAALALISIVTWTTFNFLRVVDGPSVVDTAQNKSVIVDNVAMQEVRQIFDTRAMEQAKYESGEYTFADPSK